MDFRILGPLEVSLDGRAVPLGGKKQRALLALLLLRANEVVSTDRLIDELWGETPPETVHTILQVYVSRLRKTLGQDRLVTRAPGYALRVEPGELDLERFEQLLDEGRGALAAGDPERAEGPLRDALALWRGPALADLAYEPFAQSEMARLEERRLVALEERIEADLALGHHGDLAGELETLVAKHPLRERLRAQLMLALYRSGRQAEALEAYQKTRRTLVEELGIEPSAELRELEKAILRQDSSLQHMPPGPSRTAAEATASRGVFVGRERELAELLDGLDDALAGHGRLFLVSGEPGIGKSRLAEELLSRARARGAHVFVGRCWEAGGAPAYWPWVQALRAYIRETGPETLRAQLGAGAPDVAQILPELHELLPGLPALPTLDPEGARFRLFDAVASFLRRAANAQPLVLVLDDLHAADEPSLLLLQYVARELGESGIMVVCAFRDVDPTLRDPLSSTVAELARESPTHLSLAGLAERAVSALIQLSVGLPPPVTVVAAIHRETEGNPLFVGEVVRLLASEGLLAETPEAPVSTFEIPQGVQMVIGRRLGRLSAECKRLLTLAAVLGREFPLDGLQRLAKLDGDKLLEILDDAVVERIVADIPGAPGRLRFAHALIRDSLYGELTVGRRIRLHRDAGEALEALHARDLDPHLAEVAHHFFEAAPGHDARKAADYLRRAGDRSVRLLAYEEGIRLYRTALEALRLVGHADDQERCRLMLSLGDAQARAGDGIPAKKTFLEAAALAKHLEAPELLARAALGCGGRFVWARAGADRQLVTLLEDAITALDEVDSELRARVMARLAGALRDQHDRAPRAKLSAEAVAIARRLGDPSALAYALDGDCMARFWPENLEERLEIATEVMRLAEDVGDIERAMQARYYRDVMFALEQGDIPTVKAQLETLGRLSEELKQPAHIWLVVVSSATLALFEGRFEEAEKLVAEALALGQGAQSSDAVLSSRIHRFTLGMERAELDGLDELLERSVSEYPARPMFRCMLARLAVELGREADARRLFEELAADGFAPLPRTNEWLFSLGFLAEVAAFLGDGPRALVLYELLLPYAARNASTADYVSIGSVSRYLGLLAATMSRFRDAERHFEEALEMNSRMGARPWAARTQHDYAHMLLARAGDGDRARSAELLEAALATCRELGMVALEARVSSLFRKPGAATRT